MPRRDHLAARGGDAHLEAVGDAARAHDKSLGHIGNEDFARGGLEQRKPSVEMLGPERQHQMRAHRAAIVAARFEQHRRPEVADLRDVMVPVLHRRIEDRADQIVVAGAAVERRDELRDLLLCQVGVERVNGGRCLTGHVRHLSSRAATGNRCDSPQSIAQPFPPSS